MSIARRYEELICWQLSYELQNEVFAAIAKPPANRDVKFCDQIRESSRSATRNIAEGFGRFSPAEFRRFLSIARGSLTETHNHIRDGYDRRYFDDETYDRLSRLTARAAKATGRLMAYVSDHIRRTARTPRTS